LVKSLLSFSRTAPMNLQPTDINRVLEQCVLLLRHNLDLAAIQLHTELGEGLPRLQCDPAQIEQVLLALIVNSIDAMPKGGDLWVRSAIDKTGTAVVLTVRDDGTGIPPEILAKAFEPFVTTKEQGHGTGLGLAVSRGIVERHGGKIALQSELGKGTTITIMLPAPGLRFAGGEPALAVVETKSR